MTPLNVLVAFPYFSERVAALLRSLPKGSYRLMVDSGAFTAHASGKPIALDDYCRFLDSLADLRPFHAIQLDVIGDPEGTRRNYAIMRARGYEVMPVFTRGEDPAALEEFYQGTDYVLLGNVARGAGNTAYVKWLMERNRGRKIHWLGYIDPPMLQRYRPYSVDSSHWVPGRFGQVATYAGFGKIRDIPKTEFARGVPREAEARLLRSGAEPWMVRALLTTRGWTNSCRRPSPGDTRGAVAFLSALSHLHRAEETEQRIGTRVYLATPKHEWLALLLAAKRHRAELFSGTKTLEKATNGYVCSDPVRWHGLRHPGLSAQEPRG